MEPHQTTRKRKNDLYAEKKKSPRVFTFTLGRKKRKLCLDAREGPPGSQWKDGEKGSPLCEYDKASRSKTRRHLIRAKTRGREKRACAGRERKRKSHTQKEVFLL